VGGVPVLQPGRLAALPEALAGVLAERLQQAVAPGAVGDVVGAHQRPVHQPVEQVADPVALDRPVGADRLGGLQRPAPGEDGQPGEQGPLRRAQQGEAPVHGGPQRLLPGEQLRVGVGVAQPERETVIVRTSSAAGGRPQAD
jgi:hypothetical protein